MTDVITDHMVYNPAYDQILQLKAFQDKDFGRTQIPYNLKVRALIKLATNYFFLVEEFLKLLIFHLKKFNYHQKKVT